MRRPQNSARGTYDLLPVEADIWAWVERIARETLELAGFGEIRTPIFEGSEIFLRAVGQSSDIANKELYTFEDRSNRSLSLRPEGTAGVVRAYLSNGLDRSPKPVKLWYHGPMFRYERSQKGRYRQFSQLGVEVFGSRSTLVELECIHLAMKLFSSLGLSGLTLELNSLGDRESRARYREVLQDFLQRHESQICPDCQRRTKENPLRALDCKVPADQVLYQTQAPNLKDYLSEDSKLHRDQLLQMLEESGISYKLNSRLVRGLDYYEETVFEIKSESQELGTQNTICAGGRYDRLVGEFGGPETAAFGWALGMERLVSLLGFAGDSTKGDSSKLDCLVTGEDLTKSYSLAEKIRKLGLKTHCDYEGKIKKAWDLAKKLKARKLIILENTGDFTLKSLDDGEGISYDTQAELLTALLP